MAKQPTKEELADMTRNIKKAKKKAKPQGIAVNDVVQISGLCGPLLKVLAIDEDGVHCGWYDRDIHFVSGYYKPEQLVVRADKEL